MSSLVAGGPSGREAERGRYLLVVVFLLALLVFYYPFDLLFTLDFVDDSEVLPRLLSLAVESGTTGYARMLLGLRMAAMLLPSLIQVVGGGIPAIRRANQMQVAGGKKNAKRLGIVWVLVPPFWVADVYTDYVQWVQVTTSEVAVVASIGISTGFEILIALCLDYLWQNKWVLTASEKEIARKHEEREARKKIAEAEGRLSMIPSWVMALGIALMAVGVIAVAF